MRLQRRAIHPETQLKTGSNQVHTGWQVEALDKRCRDLLLTIIAVDHDQAVIVPSASGGGRRLVTPQCQSSLSDGMAFSPAEDTGMQQPVVDGTTMATRDDGLADTVVRTLVSNGNDTLKLLFRAAEQTYSEDPQYTTSDSHASQPGDFTTPGRRSSISTEPVQRSQAAPEVLALWNAFRFAKMGWFTAQEAITLVDLSVAHRQSQVSVEG